MFTDQVGVEARPGGKVSLVDCLDPSGWHRVAAGGVQKGNVVGLGGGVIGAMRLMGVHVEAVVALAGIFKDLINHAAITGRFGVALQGKGPETGGGISVTFHDD